MSDHAAFWSAVAAAPDDDLPRLIYADWLDERGDVRGEFIRLQIAEARGAATADEVARADAWGRQHAHEWAGGVAEHALVWEFRRGFVDRVIMNAGEFLTCGDPLLAAHPVRRLTLIGAATRTE